MPTLPERTVGDSEGDFLGRMAAIRERDGAALLAVTLESRRAAPAVHECGLVASETFVFAISVASMGERTIRVSIGVTAELALALAEEQPEDADMLVAAWTELSTVADQINEAACRGGLVAERARRAGLQAER